MACARCWPVAPRPRSGPVAVAGAGAVAPRRTERRGNRRGDAGGCFGGSAAGGLAGGRRDRRTPLFKRGRSRSPRRLPTSVPLGLGLYIGRSLPTAVPATAQFHVYNGCTCRATYNIDDSRPLEARFRFGRYLKVNPVRSRSTLTAPRSVQSTDRRVRTLLFLHFIGLMHLSL